MPDTDTNLQNFYGEGRLVEDFHLAPVPPMEPWRFDDLLKLSGASRWTFRRFSVVGGAREDALDLNRGSCENTFEDGELGCGRNVAVTCKGGSCGNLWRRVKIKGRGKFADMEFGNYSAQSNEPSTGNILHDVTHESGKPVRVAFGPGSRPAIQGGKVSIVWWYTALLHVYVPLRQLLAPVWK